MVRHDLISLVEGVNENERRRELKKRRKIEHKVDAEKVAHKASLLMIGLSGV